MASSSIPRGKELDDFEGLNESKENLRRGGTRREVDELPPCKNCGRSLGPGEPYDTSDDSVEAWHTLPLYFDENAKRLRDTLRDVGGFCIVESLPDGTQDTEWLEQSGKNGWTAITQDIRIVERPNEKQALIDNKAKVFVLPEEPRNSWDTLRGFAAMWPKIEIESMYDGPFVWRYHDESHPVRWELAYPREQVTFDHMNLSRVPVGHLLNYFADTVCWHDAGYYELSLVDFIHNELREEIEARIAGKPSPTHTDLGAALLNGPTTTQTGEMKSVTLDQPIDLKNSVVLSLVSQDNNGWLRPWSFPARIMQRYGMLEDESQLPKEAGMVITGFTDGFQRPYTGVLTTRSWVKPRKRRNG